MLLSPGDSPLNGTVPKPGNLPVYCTSCYHFQRPNGHQASQTISFTTSLSISCLLAPCACRTLLVPSVQCAEIAGQGGGAADGGVLAGGVRGGMTSVFLVSPGLSIVLQDSSFGEWRIGVTAGVEKVSHLHFEAGILLARWGRGKGWMGAALICNRSQGRRYRLLSQKMSCECIS